MTGARLVRLYAVNRRVPFALLAIAACAIGLRIALLGHWDAYGALQLPLVFEVAAAVSVVATVASPFGEPERVAGRWLPYLRLAVTAALTAAAIGLLAAAGTGGHLSGGTLDVLRNVAGTHRHRPAVRRRTRRRPVLDRTDGISGRGGVRALHAVAPAGADHPVAVAGPAAPRPGRRHLRRARIHLRGRCRYRARSP